MTDIIWLSEVAADDGPRVGNKALRLAQLLQAGFPVAPGFCISTAAAAQWRPALHQRVLAAYGALGGGKVAVRSSALDEDGVSASYAGIYSSILGVDSEAALLAAIEHCVAAWHTPAARHYRAAQGAGEAFSLAILVQKLVPALAAGVAYTRDPLAPRSRRVQINAVWGLAEPLAAGRVAADSFQLSRRGKLLGSTIVAKTNELGAGGEMPVMPERVLAACLSPRQAAAVTTLALRAESFFGAPQDIEFAVTAEQVWLLQSRPIAALRQAATDPLEAWLRGERQRLARKFARLRRQGILHGHQLVLSNGNVGELLPTPSAMSFDLFRRLFAGRHGAIVAGRQRLGYRFDARCVEHLYELVAGQPYFNLEVDAATFDYGSAPALDHYLQRVVAQPELANYPELKLYGEADTQPQAAAFRTQLAAAADDFLQRFSTDIEPGLRLTTPDWQALPPAATVTAIARLIAQLRRGPCVEFVIAARLGFYFAGRLRQSLLRWFGADGEHLCAALLAALPGSLVTRQSLWLEALADRRLERAEFLAVYGHCADNELELSEPRLSECPGKLDAMLHELRASGHHPAADFAQQLAHRQAAEQSLETRLLALGASPNERNELRADLGYAQQLLPLRETIKHHYTAGHGEIRAALLHLARALGWDVELIFQLRPDELARTLREPQRQLALAQRRRQERELARQALRQRLLPSVLFGSRLQALGQPPELAHGSLWRGAGLSAGRVRGIARIVDADTDSAALLAGEFSGDEILVLRAANLGLAPLFRMVAGLIVEVGGLLAHSACQAREAGIPAVALPDATRLIADGALLWLDGSSGEVTLAPDQFDVTDQFRQESSHATL
jgi:rifampicin phosphotransferase